MEIDENHAGQRVDNYLLNLLSGVPRTLIYRILRKGEVRVNGSRCKPSRRLEHGDQLRVPPVRVAVREPGKASQGLLEALSSRILYEEKGLLVVDKPSGLAVHGGSGISIGLIEALRQLRPEETGLELVHRLDRETSGCVMIAKRRSMLRHLHEALRVGKVDKRYQALVVGQWSKRRTKVSKPLKKNVLQSGERVVRASPEGKESETHFALLRNFADCSLIEARPLTGRTHQIRVHTQVAGHPILGDEKYGDEQANRAMRQKGLKRLFLHACALNVPLPDGSSVNVEAPLAQELQTVIDVLDDS